MPHIVLNCCFATVPIFELFAILIVDYMLLCQILSGIHRLGRHCRYCYRDDCSSLINSSVLFTRFTLDHWYEDDCSIKKGLLTVPINLNLYGNGQQLNLMPIFGRLCLACKFCKILFQFLLLKGSPFTTQVQRFFPYLLS